MSWISVEERLPDEGKEVLVFEDGAVGINYIPYAQSVPAQRVGRFAGGHDYVTHWMELPAPPNLSIRPQPKEEYAKGIPQGHEAAELDSI